MNILKASQIVDSANIPDYLKLVEDDRKRRSMIPHHLNSPCADKYPLCTGCTESVKQDPCNSRFYITMGHAGFNTPANNRDGYKTLKTAVAVMVRLLYNWK